METMNMLEAMNQAIDRKATIAAAKDKALPVKEAYWKHKFIMYRGAVENIVCRYTDDPKLVEEIRMELGHILGL